jgi:alanine-synthesizing transaminase
MFSSRLRQGQGRNRLSLAIERRRGAGLPIVDLTESNPTCVGLSYPAELLEPLAQEDALRYEPKPFGLPVARHAVAADFRRRGAAVAAERIVLTASTSEAYSLLFKLLCDPGDAVLAPQPSYPLVEQLTALESVRMVPYGLEFHGRWSIDVDELRERVLGERAKASQVRAVIVISPNNPTGSVVMSAEWKTLEAFAREHELALIADEVFADYSLDGRPGASVLAQGADLPALTFGLGGMSKTVGLPQVKLGWIGIGGPNTLVQEALERLETICDTYLSVSTPVQLAAPTLLKAGAAVRGQIHDRVRGNLERLRETAVQYPSCSVLPVEAGWSAIIQVPAIRTEETIVLDLLERTGILVHPGYFFDFDTEAFLVISLLPEPASFASAVQTMFREIGRSS